MGDKFSIEREYFRKWYEKEIGPISDDDLKNVEFEFFNNIWPGFTIPDSDFEKMSEAGLCGAEAGRKLRESLEKFGDAVAAAGNDMGKLKQILEKELGPAKRFYPQLFKALDDGRRWWKPWTWGIWSIITNWLMIVVDWDSPIAWFLKARALRRCGKIKAFAAGKPRIIPQDIKVVFSDDVDGSSWDECNCDPLHVEPIKKECKSCGNAIQCGAGTSFYWFCDKGHWHGKPLENVVDFAESINCQDFGLRGSDDTP